MPDIPKIPETAPGTTPDATLSTPAMAAPAAPTAAGMPRPRSEPSVADAARLLAEHFPALFGAGVIKPIKLRIQADIHQRAPGVFTKKALSTFLQRHTTGTAYLRALVAEGATRFDLDGLPAGDIAAEHREAAGVELARRRTIVEARKQAAREAARASRQDARPQRPISPPGSSHQAEVTQAASQATDERPTTRPITRPTTRGARSVPPGTSARPDRPDRSSRPSQPGRAPRRPHKPLPERTPERQRDRAHDRTHDRAHEQAPVNAPALPLTPEQAAEAEARRRRALLLRSFEQSPLSKSNFGALNGLSEAALDSLLTLARQERGSR